MSNPDEPSITFFPSEEGSRARVKSATLRSVVIRADGAVQDLGVISYYSRSAFKRMLFRLSLRPGFRWVQRLLECAKPEHEGPPPAA